MAARHLVFEASPPPTWTAALVGVAAGAALALGGPWFGETETVPEPSSPAHIEAPPRTPSAAPAPQWLPRPQPGAHRWSLQAHERWAELNDLPTVRCEVGHLLPDAPVVSAQLPVGDVMLGAAGGIEGGELLLVVVPGADSALLGVEGIGRVAVEWPSSRPGQQASCTQVDWQSGTTSIFGVVHDDAGDPLADVQVTGCGADLLTEQDGSFYLEAYSGACALVLTREHGGRRGKSAEIPLSLEDGEDVELDLIGPLELAPLSDAELGELRLHLESLWALQQDMERKLEALGRDPVPYDHLLVEAIEPLEARVREAELARED